MCEWKPIETAPKDGNEVLVSDRYGDMYLAYNYDGEWSTDDGAVLKNLTHWFKLPEPPKRG